MAYYRLHNVAQAQRGLSLARQAAGRAKGADDPGPYLLEEAAALLSSQKGWGQFITLMLALGPPRSFFYRGR